MNKNQEKILKKIISESSTPGYENRKFGDSLPTLASVQKAYQEKNSIKEEESPDDNELLDALKAKLSDEGGAAGLDPFLKEFGKDQKKEIEKALENMPHVAKHENGDYILDDDKDVNLQEAKNCGCGQNPCKTYGRQ